MAKFIFSKKCHLCETNDQSQVHPNKYFRRGDICCRIRLLDQIEWERVDPLTGECPFHVLCDYLLESPELFQLGLQHGAATAWSIPNRSGHLPFELLIHPTRTRGYSGHSRWVRREILKTACRQTLKAIQPAHMNEAFNFLAEAPHNKDLLQSMNQEFGHLVFDEENVYLSSAIRASKVCQASFWAYKSTRPNLHPGGLITAVNKHLWPVVNTLLDNPRIDIFYMGIPVFCKHVPYPPFIHRKLSQMHFSQFRLALVYGILYGSPDLKVVRFFQDYPGLFQTIGRTIICMHPG